MGMVKIDEVFAHRTMDLLSRFDGFCQCLSRNAGNPRWMYVIHLLSWLIIG